MSVQKTTVNKAIREIMRSKGVTLQSMAKSIKKEEAKEVSSRLGSKNMTFDKAIEMLSVMGYEVVVQPRTSGDRKAGQYVIVHSSEVNGDTESSKKKNDAPSPVEGGGSE